MSDVRYVTLGPESVHMLMRAGRIFGDDTLEAALARAIGTYVAIAPLADRGVLTLVDTGSDGEQPETITVRVAEPRQPEAEPRRPERAA